MYYSYILYTHIYIYLYIYYIYVKQTVHDTNIPLVPLHSSIFISIFSINITKNGIC